MISQGADAMPQSVDCELRPPNIIPPALCNLPMPQLPLCKREWLRRLNQILHTGASREALHE